MLAYLKDTFSSVFNVEKLGLCFYFFGLNEEIHKNYIKKVTLSRNFPPTTNTVGCYVTPVYFALFQQALAAEC